MKLLVMILSCVLVFSLPSLARAADYVLFDNVKILEGDNPVFAEPDFDDSDWESLEPAQIDPQGRLIWVRASLSGKELQSLGAVKPLGFFLSALAAREVYFNGVRIGQSGSPSRLPADETPGTLDAVYFLPTEIIRSGSNVFAIRMSSHHIGTTIGHPLHSFHIAEYNNPTARRMAWYMPSIIAGGAIALGAFYFLGFFASNRRELTSLALGVLALAVAGQLAAEVSRAFIHYPYTFHMTRMYSLMAFAGLAGAAMLSFSLLRFAPEHFRLISGGTVLTATASVLFAPGYDPKVVFIILAAALGSLVAAVIGIVRRKPGAMFAAGGFAIFIAVAFLTVPDFLDKTYYLAMAALIVVLFAMQIRLLGFERRAREETGLRAVRLRHELLKRQIQPHFLMNTLTTLSEWVESDPATGVRMIEALSDELRLLYEMSEEKLVPLKNEIVLCERHLEVMSLRANADFSLQVTGDTENISCPPATLLTLIENAFSHNEYQEATQFDINVNCRDSETVIHCHTPIRNRQDDRQSGGAGLAYIRARFAEAFGDNWSLQSEEANNDTWVTSVRWAAS